MGGYGPRHFWALVRKGKKGRWARLGPEQRRDFFLF
jgi:hypothetical protein